MDEWSKATKDVEQQHMMCLNSMIKKSESKIDEVEQQHMMCLNSMIKKSESKIDEVEQQHMMCLNSGALQKIMWY